MAQQEEALIGFEQAILNAGSEVSNALVQYQTAQDKIEQREKQIFSLRKIRGIHARITNFRNIHLPGSTTAQQSLLMRNSPEYPTRFQLAYKPFVNLYHALGGGRTTTNL